MAYGLKACSCHPLNSLFAPNLMFNSFGLFMSTCMISTDQPIHVSTEVCADTPGVYSYFTVFGPPALFLLTKVHKMKCCITLYYYYQRM